MPPSEEKMTHWNNFFYRILFQEIWQLYFTHSDFYNLISYDLFRLLLFLDYYHLTFDTKLDFFLDNKMCEKLQISKSEFLQAILASLYVQTGTEVYT